MDIKFFLFATIIILGVMLGSGAEDKSGKKRKWFVIIMITLLILESSLRSLSVGTDTIHYYASFVSYQHLSWTDVFDSFRSAYIEGEDRDPGFLFLVKTVQLVSLDFNVFLFVCALVFFIPLGCILYRYSSHILQLVFAFTLYVALFHIVALSGIRQQVATGFSFLALLQLGKNRYWLTLLFIALGSLIHISVLIFLLVPTIQYFVPKSVKSIHLASFATIPFVLAFASNIMFFLASFLANDYYETYAESESSGGAYTYIILMELLSLFCYFAIKRDTIINNPTAKLLYVMLPLLTITAPLISLNGAMIRVGQYFTLYTMLLVPVAIDSIQKGINRKMFYYGLIIVLIFLSQRGAGFNYSFFWQNNEVLF